MGPGKGTKVCVVQRSPVYPSVLLLPPFIGPSLWVPSAVQATVRQPPPSTVCGSPGQAGATKRMALEGGKKQTPDIPQTPGMTCLGVTQLHGMTPGVCFLTSVPPCIDEPARFPCPSLGKGKGGKGGKPGKGGGVPPAGYRCHNCDEVGHWKENCHLPQKQWSRDDKGGKAWLPRAYALPSPYLHDGWR